MNPNNKTYESVQNKYIRNKIGTEIKKEIVNTFIAEEITIELFFFSTVNRKTASYKHSDIIGKNNSERLLTNSATPYVSVVIYDVYNGKRTNCITFANTVPITKIKISENKSFRLFVFICIQLSFFVFLPHFN